MREGGDGEDSKLGYSSEKMLADLQNQIDREEISPMKTHPTAKDEEEEKEFIPPMAEDSPQVRQDDFIYPTSRCFLYKKISYN